MTHSNHIPLLHLKSRRTMRSDIMVTLLEPVVFSNKMQIITSNNNGSRHLRRNDHPLNNSPTNTHFASKRTFIVDVSTFNRGSRRFKT